MNSSLKCLIFAFFLCANPIFAQQKISLEETALNRNLQPKNFSQVLWISNQTVAMTENFDKIRFAYLVKGKMAFGSKALTLSELKLGMTAEGAELNMIPNLTWKNNKFYFENNFAIWETDTLAKAKKINQWEKEAQFTDLSPNFDVAYIKNDNIFLKTTQENASRQITNDGSKDLVYGQAVHRSEFGIHKGLFWANDGTKLAFYQMNQSMVKDYPLLNTTQKPAQVEWIKYPMAGEKSHHVKIGVYDLKSQKTIYLKTGEPAEQYLTNITWSPDNTKIYVAIVNREQNSVNLNRYDAQTGELEKTLFTEKHEKYVEPENGLTFLPNNPKQFIWQSERTDFNQLYLYDTDGNLIKALTSGTELVVELMNFDEKGEKLFFRHIGKRQIERHVSILDLKTNKIQQITSETGTHTVFPAPNAKYFVDSYTSQTVPRKVQILQIYEKQNVNIGTLLNSPNPLENYDAPSIEISSLKASDGKDLFYCIIKPKNFDATKKYPVLVYVYGGSHAQLVTETWRGGADYFLQYAAQEGFIVFTLDNHGSADRGLAFENATFRRLGEVEIDDQLKGVEFLKTLPYADTNKMAIYGWSFGGFMTTTMMLTHPNLFKVAVAGGPVMDWGMYEIMYTERYMDTPSENPEGFEKTNLINKVEKLEGRLLLIHGQKDDVVVPQHTLQFMQKCIEKRKLVDTFFYPTHPHNVRGKDRVHLNKVIFDYIQRGL